MGRFPRGRHGIEKHWPLMNTHRNGVIIPNTTTVFLVHNYIDNLDKQTIGAPVGQLANPLLV